MSGSDDIIGVLLATQDKAKKYDRILESPSYFLIVNTAGIARAVANNRAAAVQSLYQGEHVIEVKNIYPPRV